MDYRVSNSSDLERVLDEIRTSQEENTISFEADVKIALDKALPVLVSHAGTRIYGNGASLTGTGEFEGLIIEGNKIEISGLDLSSFSTGIYIRASERNAKQISVNNCSFHEIPNASVMTGITVSDLSIEDVKITDNLFEAPSKEVGGEESAAGHCSCATCLFTAIYDTGDHPIHNVALRRVEWSRNRTIANLKDGNKMSEGLQAHGATNYAFFNLKEMVESSANDVTHSVFEDLTVEDNILEGIYDFGATILASFPGRSDCLLQNVVVRRNQITYFNNGIGVGSTNSCAYGSMRRMLARNILIEDNHLKPAVPGPFEPQIGIMIFNTRCESQTMTCRDCRMEDVVIRGNEIYGREVGIAIEAQHGTQELPNPSEISDCSIERVTIENNKIINAQLPIRIFAVHMESRVDDFWGYPVTPFDRSLPFSTRAEGNKIDYVTIAGNQITAYDTALTVSAVWAGGNTFSRHNTVGPHITIRDNERSNGKVVFTYSKHIEDNILYGDAVGADNHVYGNYDI